MYQNNKKMKPSKLILLFLILQISSKKTEVKDETTHIFLIKTNLTKEEVETLLNGNSTIDYDDLDDMYDPNDLNDRNDTDDPDENDNSTKTINLKKEEE